MNTKEKIENYLSFFEEGERTSTKEKYIFVNRNAPQELKDSIRGAHGERLPDDWIYSTYHSILETINEYDTNTAAIFSFTSDYLNDIRSEIVDGLVDIYTSDLTSWLNASNYNVYYITEAQEEYGAQTDGFKILQIAQYKAIDEIYESVISLLGNDEEKEIE